MVVPTRTWRRVLSTLPHVAGLPFDLVRVNSCLSRQIG